MTTTKTKKRKKAIIKTIAFFLLPSILIVMYLLIRYMMKYFTKVKNKNFWAEIKHFQPHEFDEEKGDGTGFEQMDEDLIRRLDKARSIAGVPFQITSGYRTPLKNSQLEGAVKGSAHTVGKAVDIRWIGRENYFKILNALKQVGFIRIGHYIWSEKENRGTIHVDNSTIKPQVQWYNLASTKTTKTNWEQRFNNIA